MGLSPLLLQITMAHPIQDVQVRFNRRFREVMRARTMDDIVLKMQAIKNKPQDELTRIFIEVCDVGISLYIQVEQRRFPQKSREEIMRDYYLQRKQDNGD
jgi:hypothetical protein